MQELQRLLLDAERPNVQNHLAQHISKLKTELDHLQSVQQPSQPQKQAPPVVVVAKEENKINYQPLTKYAW